MMRSVRAACVVISCCACALGCYSLPSPPPLSAAETEKLKAAAPSRLHVVVKSCDFELSKSPGLCKQEIDDVVEVLRATGLFAHVRASDLAGPGTDILIVVQQPPRRPYHTVPVHNPAFSLLSSAIPFWWSEPHGYRFSVENLPASRMSQVDTTWEGTAIAWSLAPLFNLSSNRGFSERHDREVARIKLQLLPIIRKYR